jgi:hypothetical protein
MVCEISCIMVVVWDEKPLSRRQFSDGRDNDDGVQEIG